jgi:plastocyanin
MTYGHDLNWLILLIISVAGALIRQFFVIRIQKPKNARLFLIAGVALLVGVVLLSKEPSGAPKEAEATVAPVNAPVVVPPAETATESVFQAVDAKIDSGSPSANVQASIGIFNLTGVVKFEGKAPVLPKIMLPQACAKKIVGEAHSNEIIINNQKIQNVLVRIVQGHEKLPIPPVPSEAVLLDQRGCFYEPRVIAARVGQEVVFINSDEVFHNVRSITQQNTAFNIGMPQKNQRESRRFNKAEIFIQTKCSVHPWMMAHIAVVEHPYFDVTKADGSFEIKGLPPGNYTVEFWHEVFGTKQEKITVTDKGTEPLTEIFK